MNEWMSERMNEWTNGNRWNGINKYEETLVSFIGL